MFRSFPSAFLPERLSSDAVVFDPRAGEFFLVVNVASVEKHRGAHDALDDLPCRKPEFLPFGHQNQRIGVYGGFVHLLGIADTVADARPACLHSHRIVGGYGSSRRENPVDQHERRGFPHIVRFGFESQPPQGDLPPRQIAAETLGQLVEKHPFLPLVDPLDRREDLHRIAVLLGRSDQRLDVFREAGAAVAAARVKKLASDACVAADSLADHVHVRSDDFAQVGDVVHEADAGGEHAVRGVFGHLGRGDVHEDYPEIVQQEGAVQPTHQLFRALALDSDHYAVGAHEVFDGAAFFQKLGIGSHVEFDFGSPAGELLPHDLLNPARRAYRNGALGDQQRIFLDCRAERPRHFEHVAQIGVAVLVRRGSESNFVHHDNEECRPGLQKASSRQSD